MNLKLSIFGIYLVFYKQNSVLIPQWISKLSRNELVGTGFASNQLQPRKVFFWILGCFFN